MAEVMLSDDLDREPAKSKTTSIFGPKVGNGSFMSVTSSLESGTTLSSMWKVSLVAIAISRSKAILTASGVLPAQPLEE